MMECVLCALLSCLPGYYSSGCAAGSTRDAVCLPCLMANGEGGMAAPGSFAWTDGCEYACSAGFRRVNGTLCLPCSAPSCGPGFWASECTDASDSVCLPCLAPVSGPLNWTSSSSGCGDFECAAGTYLDRGAASCLPCSENLVCLAGLRPVACTRTEDSSCAPCAPPVGDPAGSVWKEEQGGGAGGPCEVECAPGYYYNGAASSNGSLSAGKNCTRCTARACAVGTYAAGCEVGGSSDSRCEACVRPQGVFAWTGVVACQFSCVLGWSWRNGTACVDCVEPVCSPGTYLTPCTLSAPATCIPCDGGGGAVEGGVVYTSGCSFVCAAGYFLAAGGVCRRCSAPVCAPGSYLRPCGVGSDAACVACAAPIAGRIRWIGTGCSNFTCADGAYRDWDNDRCVDCSSPWCAPGYRAGACSATSNAECVPCDPPPFAAASSAAQNTTSYVWVNDGSAGGCAFECAAGYFLHPVLGSCERCSTDGCDNGFYRSGCTPLADAVCEPCLDEGDPGGAVWTHRCAFVCNTGYYMNQQRAWCSRCSRPACTAVGYTVSPCTATQDARCVPCQLSTAGSAGVVWVGSATPCSFICASGYYYYLNYTGGGAARGCLPCSVLSCPRGMRPSPCNLTSDSVCVSCTPPGGGAAAVGGALRYEWVDGTAQQPSCAFVCKQGYYRVPKNAPSSSSSCVACSTAAALACAPGTYYWPCSATEDAFCAPCPALTSSLSGGGGARWVASPASDCAFECVEGFYLSTAAGGGGGGGSATSSCARCLTDQACAPGFRAAGCNSTANAACVECDASEWPGANGTFVWTAPGCTSFSCVFGEPVVDGGGGRAACPPAPAEVMAFVVVDTALSMNNTANDVCRELDALLRALSDALARVSECGCVQFVTIATSLDGEACQGSVCPQCGLLNTTGINSSFPSIQPPAPSSRRRRLMLSEQTQQSVSLTTTSTSISPVPLAVVADQAPPAAPLLQTELAASLASVAPALVPAGVAAAVSNVVTQPPPSSVRRLPPPNPPVLLSVSVIVCIIVAAAMLAVCTRAVCSRGCIPWSRGARLLAPVQREGGSAIGLQSGMDAQFSLHTQPPAAVWMPRLSKRRQPHAGNGRDRELADPAMP